MRKRGEARPLSMGQNAVWNTAGALLFNLCLWGTTMAAVRLTPDFTAPGRLQLAMAVSNVFAVASSWELKTCLAADAKERYAAGEYLGAQAVTGGLALALALGYAVLCGYFGEALAVIGVYMLYRVLQSRSEVYYGAEQKHFRMDSVGISYGIRGVGMLGAFVLGLRLTGSVTAAVGGMAAVTAAVLWLYDRPRAGRLEDVRPVFSRRIWTLLGESLPAVIAAALLTAAATLPRQVLETMGGTEALGIYATVATPVVALQVLAMGIFDPAVPVAAERWARGDGKALGRLGGQLFALLLILSLAALAAAHWLGRWALVLLYGETIAPYSGMLLPAVGCAVLFSGCWMLGRMLIVMGEMKAQLAITALGLLTAGALARPLIARWGGNGVSWAIMAGYGICFVLSLIHILRRADRRKKEDDHEYRT